MWARPVGERGRIAAILLGASVIIVGLVASYLLVAREPSEPLVYTGSSTIGEKLVPSAFASFTRQSGAVIGPIETPGSGEGIEAVKAGRAAFAGVARPFYEGEDALNLRYMIFGYDAIALFVHPDNPVKDLSRKQIGEIFTGRIRNWQDVGGRDESITVITETSGKKRATMLEFQRLAFKGDDYLAERVEVDKPADQVESLADNPNGIISVSVAFDMPDIKLISVDGVLPVPKAIRSYQYFAVRPLMFVYEGRPQGTLRDFFDFMLSDEGQTLVGQKFVPIKS